LALQAFLIGYGGFVDGTEAVNFSLQFGAQNGELFGFGADAFVLDGEVASGAVAFIALFRLVCDVKNAFWGDLIGFTVLRILFRAGPQVQGEGKRE